MVRATIVCGSADKGGVTNKMCESAADVLKSKGYDVSIFYPSEMNIGHCRDCGGCANGHCIIDDDMPEILDAFSDSELLILSGPIHFSGPSSLLKTVMDRFQPYWMKKDMKHPEYCIAMLCGGSKQPVFDITERIIRAFCLTTGMEYRGSLQIPDTDSGVDDIVQRVNRFLSVW